MIIIASLSVKKKSNNGRPVSPILPIVAPIIILNMTIPNTLVPDDIDSVKSHFSKSAVDGFTYAEKLAGRISSVRL